MLTNIFLPEILALQMAMVILTKASEMAIPMATSTLVTIMATPTETVSWDSLTQFLNAPVTHDSILTARFGRENGNKNGNINRGTCNGN